MNDVEREALDTPWDALNFLVWILVEADAKQLERIDIEAAVPKAAEDVRVALREWQKLKELAMEEAMNTECKTETDEQTQDADNQACAKIEDLQYGFERRAVAPDDTEAK